MRHEFADKLVDIWQAISEFVAGVWVGSFGEELTKRAVNLVNLLDGQQLNSVDLFTFTKIIFEKIWIFWISDFLGL